MKPRLENEAGDLAAQKIRSIVQRVRFASEPLGSRLIRGGSSRDWLQQEALSKRFLSIARGPTPPRPAAKRSPYEETPARYTPNPPSRARESGDPGSCPLRFVALAAGIRIHTRYAFLRESVRGIVEHLTGDSPALDEVILRSLRSKTPQLRVDAAAVAFCRIRCHCAPCSLATRRSSAPR